MKVSRRRGISGILSGAILFGIIFTTGATYFTSVQTSARLVHDNSIESIRAAGESKEEAFSVLGLLDNGNFILSNITNDGNSAMRIMEIFVINPNGTLVNHMNTDPLPATINAADSHLINTTVPYDNGTYRIRVVSARGNVALGQYPIPTLPLAEISEQLIENITISVTTKAIGKLLIDFESFQFCRPDIQDCTEASSDWGPGWRVDKSNEYLFRIKIRNTTNRTIFFEKNSAILMLQAQEAGGGNLPSDLYIKDPPVLGDDDGAPYTNWTFALPPDDAYHWLYIGADNVGGDMLQNLPQAGIYTVNLIIFGYWDGNGSGAYEVGIDADPYSQNIPFQGMLIDP